MWFPIGSQYGLTMYIARLSRYWASKISGSRLWPFAGHVTSSVTWPLDSQYGVSYRWSIWTDYISRTVFEILSFKGIGVTTLTFGVTWDHRSCDHWIHNVRFLIDSQYELTLYLAWLSRYWASKISESRLWLFGVQPMLKAKKLTVHASYHVTYRKGSKTTTYLESPTLISLFTDILRGSDDE